MRGVESGIMLEGTKKQLERDPQLEKSNQHAMMSAEQVTLLCLFVNHEQQQTSKRTTQCVTPSYHVPRDAIYSD